MFRSPTILITLFLAACAFAIPSDPSRSEGGVSLYFQLGDTCDPETSQVFEVPVSLPGSVDLSTLPETSFTGCWLFE